MVSAVSAHVIRRINHTSVKIERPRHVQKNLLSTRSNDEQFAARQGCTATTAFLYAESWLLHR